MLSRLLKIILTLLILTSRPGQLSAQSREISRILTVKDGLPQSYVSGIFQDHNGFLWISTLNGFCRYDGLAFRYYRHTYADTNGLGGNIIIHLFDAGNDQLLLCYMDGRMDLINTVTEKITPLWKDSSFNILKYESRYFRSLVRDSRGLCWMMAGDSGILRLDLHRHTASRLPQAMLQLPSPVLGLSVLRDTLLLLMADRLAFVDSAGKKIKELVYPFQTIRPYDAGLTNIYSPDKRGNGDLIIPDEEGIKIWNTSTGFYKTVPFKRDHRPGKLIAGFDRSGNYFFECNGGISVLRPDNVLVSWSLPSPNTNGVITSMCIDRSGVLWGGTNGFGLRQYNLLKTGLHGYNNEHSFVTDVLGHCGISYAQAAGTFIGSSVPFANRSAGYNDSVWVTDVYQPHASPQLVLFTGQHISEQSFRNETRTAKKELYQVTFLTCTKAGILWGIDQHMRLMRFNAKQSSFRVFPHVGLEPGEELNGMSAESESVFYITTTRHLIRADTLGHTEQLTDLLPSKELLTVCVDPEDADMVWIGTLSDGLVRLNKTTRKTQVFSMATGLPNNTVYSILPGKDGQLWCSSNKGIFAFSKQHATVRSFTSRDGLADDEFNRFYYMVLPQGELAFGGPMGYTIFNPSKLETDNYAPAVVLTGLDVINRPHSDTMLSGLQLLHLRYDQNFITAEFAAMQFDFPEKIQYRYMLEGFDKDWILTGNENKAFYTNLPPGSYTLLLNASNTSGKWSSHIRSIGIVIDPPFWRTWWFYTAAILLLVLLVYGFLRARIRSLKKAHSRQLQFERKAMELQAMALRARMNPHFIFNCLNSIKALIQEKEDKKAITYLTTFVTLIRKQLSNTGDKVTLQEELDTCRLYLRLEAMRFNERISYEFDIAEDIFPERVMVPPLMLQPVIENAVVHGLLPVEEGGLVIIRVYRGKNQVICSIEDNGIGRAASAALRAASNPLHESKGRQMLEERILIHNHLNEWGASMETIDLYNDSGKPCGTRVILKFDAGT